MWSITDSRFVAFWCTIKIWVENLRTKIKYVGLVLRGLLFIAFNVFQYIQVMITYHATLPCFSSISPQLNLNFVEFRFSRRWFYVHTLHWTVTTIQYWVSLYLIYLVKMSSQSVRTSMSRYLRVEFDNVVSVRFQFLKIRSTDAIQNFQDNIRISVEFEYIK